MTSVTAYYGIASPVPFLDVNVHVDRPMFVDPRAVRLQGGPQPFASMANRCTETFFDEITRCVTSSRPADGRRGLELLTHFVEPWETRLGLSAGGFHGHGGAEDVGRWIWQALTTDLGALVQVGVLKQIEDVPIFVEGIAEDITSDLTTRIIFEPLADFTADVVRQYPEFTQGAHFTADFERQVWDPAGLRWSTARLTLPVADGKPLLLVPRDWARHTLLMSATRYYETAVLGYAQMEQAVVSRATGKLVKTPKDVLKEQAALARGRATVLAVTRRALAHDEDLLRQFKAYVDSKYEPLSESMIERKLS